MREELSVIQNVLGLRHVGGDRCQPFLKHNNHWKRALKMIFKGSGCFQFPKAVITSTANESLRSTEWFTTKSRSLGVESAEYKVPSTKCHAQL